MCPSGEHLTSPAHTSMPQLSGQVKSTGIFSRKLEAVGDLSHGLLGKRNSEKQKVDGYIST